MIKRTIVFINRQIHMMTRRTFTDLFSFSSEEESSPHNSSPLEAEELYLHIPCIGRCIHTNTEANRIEDCHAQCMRSKFSAGQVFLYLVARPALHHALLGEWPFGYGFDTPAMVY